MTERNAGRNGNDRSSRVCGVSARTVGLAGHSLAAKPNVAGAAVAEPPIGSGVVGWGNIMNKATGSVIPIALSFVFYEIPCRYHDCERSEDEPRQPFQVRGLCYAHHVTGVMVCPVQSAVRSDAIDLLGASHGVALCNVVLVD